MKKASILILLILICCLGYGQTYPLQQNVGNTPTTKVKTNALEGKIIITAFTDTSAANSEGYLKNYDGAVIKTTTPINALWYRVLDSAKWVQILPTGGGTGGIRAWLDGGNYNVLADGQGNAVFGTLGKNGIKFTTQAIPRFILDSAGILSETGSTIGIGYDPSNGNRLTQYSGGGGSGNYLDSFWRVPGIDSNYYRINGVTYAVLDSTGGGGINIYNSDGTLTADRTIDANGKLFEIQSATKNQFILDPVNQYWAMGDWAGDFGNATSIHIADSIGEVRINGDLNVHGAKPYDFTHDNYPIYWDQQTQDYKSGWSIDSLWRASADSLKFRVAGSNTKAGIFSIYAPTSTGNYLDSFWRVSGIDSNYYRINGVTYAVKDSTGGGGGVTGSGTSNTMTKWTGSGSIGNALLTDDGSILGATLTPTTTNGLALTSSTVTTGNLMKLTNTGTAAASNTKNVLAIVSSGANSTSSQTVTGQTISVTNTGTTNTNVAASFSASGATNNYGLLVPSGNVGIGTTKPLYEFQIDKSSAGSGVWGNIRNTSSSGYSAFSLGNNLGSTIATIYNFGSTYGSTGQYKAGKTLFETNSDLYISNTSGGATIFYSGSVSIGTSVPVASAALDITSTTKGLLIPRMTTANKNAISSPASALQLYDTDLKQPQYYDGTSWKAQVGMTFGTAAPAITPAAVGNFFLDTTNKKLYVSTGTASSADWNILN